MDSRAESGRTAARTRFELLLYEFEAMVVAERDAQTGIAAKDARTRLAENLNQGLRRLRGAQTIAESAALLCELAKPFSSRSAVFLFRDGLAEAVAAHRLGALPFSFEPNRAAAFRASVESGDPVVALGTEAEMSEAVAARLDQENEERVHLFPVSVRGAVQGVLLASGTTEAAALELLANVAALRWEVLTPAIPLPGTDPQRMALVTISGAATAADPPTSEASATTAGWADLSAELQALHRRAQRFARVRVAEIRLADEAALRRGFAQYDLYNAMRQSIDQAREEFRREYLSKSPTMVDYLYLEMLRGLAGNEDNRFGTGFPGPLK